MLMCSHRAEKKEKGEKKGRKRNTKPRWRGEWRERQDKEEGRESKRGQIQNTGENDDRGFFPCSHVGLLKVDSPKKE